MIRHPATVLCSLTAICSTALAQADWTQLSPAIAPSNRAGMVGVSDGTGMLFFGGKPSSTTEVNDLWRFDGTSWTDLTPTTGPLPPARDFYASAYDSGRGRLVVFGGRSTALASDLGDTWEFDGTTWTQMTPAIAPSTRRWAAMTFDSARNVCVLFGGNLGGGSTYYNDTWTWDGTTWTQLAPATSPSLRGRGFFSYDFVRGEAIYFGGRNSAGALTDTWKWDGVNWNQIVTLHAPGAGTSPGLFAYGATWDFVRDRHVIFGGTRTGGTLAGTWEFDGTDWEQRAPATVPTSRTGPAVAFVLGLGKTIMFGGFQSTQLGDTLEYQTAQLASAATFGAGCTGGGGVVTLTPGNQPWLGDTFTATVSNLAVGSLVFNVIGFSSAAWSGGALPLPLALVHPAGGAGCNLLVSNDAVILLLNLGGPITTAMNFPNSPAFAGMTLHQQVLQIELAGANIASITASNGLSVTLGAR